MDVDFCVCLSRTKQIFFSQLFSSLRRSKKHPIFLVGVLFSFFFLGIWFFIYIYHNCHRPTLDGRRCWMKTNHSCYKLLCARLKQNLGVFLENKTWHHRVTWKPVLCNDIEQAYHLLWDLKVAEIKIHSETQKWIITVWDGSYRWNSATYSSTSNSCWTNKKILKKSFKKYIFHNSIQNWL